MKDTRFKKKCTYKLWDIVCVVILAVLSNCNEWEEIYYFTQTHKKWLSSFLKLTGSIPQPLTYERVISIIDSSELNNICVEFMFRLVQLPINPQYDFYHFDGKVDKSSGRKTNIKTNEIIKNLNVYSDLLSMCIDQEMIAEKTNEITAIPDVINRLNIKCVICTWDALNTQKTTVKAVIDGKGDYVGALKGNHWNIENKLHWQLDFTFKADENTTVNKKALFNLQIIKKIGLNVLNSVKEEYKCSLKKIRFQIGLNAPQELEKIFKILSKKVKN